MSLSEPSNRRENTTQRPRNSNHFRNNRREWIPRGTPALSPSVVVVPSVAVDGLSSNERGNGGESVNRSAQPVFQHRNRGNFGSRGNPPRHVNQQREEIGNGKSNRHGGAAVAAKDGSIPQLVQEIQDKLLKGSVECMICYDMVKRYAPIWSCCSCYSIFHLTCIKKWARAPTSIDLMAEKNQGFNWRCPGCQSVQLMSSKEIRYMCFCGKSPDPPSDLYLTPHSCGEPCGKQLLREVPGSDLSKEDICPHVCVLQCHPGPCPPCKAFAPPRRCPCGKKVITTRCSDRKSVLTCGDRCDKLLDCGRHHCESICHLGPCDPCQVLVNASCFCNKTTEVVMCGDVIVKGEVKVEDGVFSCSVACEKKLNCGNHDCHDICHPGPCGECELLPGKVKTCCCGKTALKEDRQSCLDPIPTCPDICGKILPCGLHHCQDVCHSGICSPCHMLVTQNCRCGSMTRTVECSKTIEGSDKFTCGKPCGRKKNCGRHRCNERCCPLSNSSPLADWDPHLCSMPCEKKLRCGQHSCVSLCHSGHCPPCLETIFTDLTCACGRSSIPPPLPCGTPPPACQHSCLVTQPCGHPSSHSCHFGDCPPCSVPIGKECVGGHMGLRNIPCGLKDIRCNKVCGKARQCGLHACSRPCHPSPCDSASTRSSSCLRKSCGQTCGAPRRGCRHTCTSLCHPSTSCPDIRCEFPVTITCSCGRLTATVPCDAGGNSGSYSVDSVREASILSKLPAPVQPLEGTGQKIPLGQRKLMCDDECAKGERKKLLADAFGVTAPNLDALHFGDNLSVSEVLSDLLRRDAKWVLSVEERCKYLVLGRGRGGGGVNSLKVHVFCPMTKEKRDAVRLIAERWKLSINSNGWEPKRFVVVHVTPKSKAPTRVLGVKSCNPSSNLLQPPAYDNLVDMDPRLVVALFDLPRDGDISALVLRFGGECELVWLNDKNALSVFSYPDRAATAMKRLDQGSVYYGAVAVPQNGSISALISGSNAWGSKDSAAAKGNPWKSVVKQDSDWKESSWGSEEWSGSAAASESLAWKDKEVSVAAASTNRWSVLESGSSSNFSDTSKNMKNKEHLRNSSVLSTKPEETSSNLLGQGEEMSNDVVDDWEKICD